VIAVDHAYVPAVVIGAGPTGLTAAIMLGQRGTGCLVLERWPDVYPLPRAVHFDDEVFRIFAGMGLEDEVRAISRPAPGMQLTDVQHRLLAELRRAATSPVNGYPEANMFDQPELEGVLRAALGRHPSVELRGGVEVFEVTQPPDGPAPVRVRYRDGDTGAEHEVWADAVLGCDGANSMTRGVVGATMEDLHFEQRWLVVDIRSPEPLDVYDGVQQVCDADRAATFMPVVDGRYRWEFRLRHGESPEDFTPSRVRELIRPWLRGVDPEAVTVLRQACYTFRGVVADRWRNGRVFLLGDAAHQTPPFIGQGMCAGVRDAANLAWKLALVLDGRAHDRLLETYEAERRPYARRVVQLAIAIGWVMTGGTARTARPRRAALRFAARLPRVEARAITTMWPAFTPGPLVSCGRRRSPAGKLCPQARVHHRVDDVLLDELLATGFAVIHRGADRTRAFDPGTRRFFDDLGTTIIDLNETDDADGALAAMLDEANADAVLVRPDHIIAATADSADLWRWRQQLERAGITGCTRARLPS
jgi:3-(3-hydroxy-phenyl)propionate hydroxylase